MGMRRRAVLQTQDRREHSTDGHAAWHYICIKNKIVYSIPIIKIMTGWL